MGQVKEKAKKNPSRREISREELEMTAYFHWLDRGCPEGDSLTDWIEAEKRLEKSQGMGAAAKKG